MNPEQIDTNQMLQRAVDEIKMLRDSNRIMSIRLKMFDDMMQLANMEPPQRGYAHSIDFVQEIETYLKIKNERKDEQK